MTKGMIYFVDDEEHLRISSRQSLELDGHSVTCFEAASKALESIDRDFDGIVVSDIRMPEMDGMKFIKRVLEIHP
ncbi:MAG: response regulator, partial [Pseudomonadota bacterium]